MNLRFGTSLMQVSLFSMLATSAALTSGCSSQSSSSASSGSSGTGSAIVIGSRGDDGGGSDGGTESTSSSTDGSSSTSNTGDTSNGSSGSGGSGSGLRTSPWTKSDDNIVGQAGDIEGLDILPNDAGTLTLSIPMGSFSQEDQETLNQVEGIVIQEGALQVETQIQETEALMEDFEDLLASIIIWIPIPTEEELFSPLAMQFETLTGIQESTYTYQIQELSTGTLALAQEATTSTGDLTSRIEIFAPSSSAYAHATRTLSGAKDIEFALVTSEMISSSAGALTKSELNHVLVQSTSSTGAIQHRVLNPSSALLSVTLSPMEMRSRLSGISQTSSLLTNLITSSMANTSRIRILPRSY